ncbi:polysaccharide biosynthesis C-terminal domain-containing protein [Octadecabacter sp.]|nr:polysaccharide biosynthesis C-terminal domain-containing protein [Octadecabacter sp.]
MEIIKVGLLKVTNQIGSVITTVLLIAILSKETYGLYAVLTSILLITLNTYNNGAAIVEAKRTAEENNLRPQLQKVLLLSIPIIVFEITLLYISLPSTVENITLIIIFSTYFCIENLKFFLSGHLRGQGKTQYGAILITMPSILLCGFIFLFKTSISEVHEVFLFKVTSSFLVIVYTVVKTNIKLSFTKTSPITQTTAQFVDGLKVGIASVSNQLNKNIGILLLGSLMGFTAVTDYKISLLMAFPMTIPAFLMTTIMIRPIKLALTGHNKNNYKTKIIQVQYSNILIYLPSVILILYINNIVAYLNLESKFIVNEYIAFTQLTTLFIQNMFGPTNLLIHMQNKSLTVMKITTIGLAINIIVSYIMIIQIGIIGAVLGSLVSVAFVQVLGRHINNKLGVIQNGSVEILFKK